MKYILSTLSFLFIIGLSQGFAQDTAKLNADGQPNQVEQTKEPILAVKKDRKGVIGADGQPYQDETPAKPFVRKTSPNRHKIGVDGQPYTDPKELKSDPEKDH